MDDATRTRSRRYGVAIVAVVVASSLNMMVWWWTRPISYPFFFAAVLFTAWRAGMGPGLLATGLSVLASLYLFVEPFYSFALNPRIAIRVAEFLGVSWAICYFTTARLRVDRALRESESRYRLMLESVRDHAIFMTDLSGNITSWDIGAERLLDYKGSEILGKNVSILFTPEDARAGKPEKELEEARTKGRAEDERWHVRKDGSRYFATGIVNPVKDDAGNLRGFIKVMRDITERKQAEEELAALVIRERESRERAEAIQAEVEGVNRAKDRFLAMLSHELRTPLTPVLLMASALLDDPKTSEEMRPTWEMIRQNIGLEARLIDDLLDVMRTVQGKMVYRWEVVDAHDLMRQTLEIVQSDLYGNNLRLVLKFEATEFHVKADPARLTQAFWNLIRNGVKFTDEGGTITIRTRNEGERFVVEVEDTGIGIDPAALPKLFNAFEQVEDDVTRKFGGLGLGLAISKSVVEGHGGHIAASSLGKGHGATFTIEIPTVAPAASTIGPTTPAATDGKHEHQHFNILLVEDDAMTCRIMATQLRNAGHTVTTATCCKDALKVAHSEFDLVVSDVGLPDCSGHELMRQLKTRYGLKGVALTGYGMDEDIQRSHDAGFVAHMTKPVDFPSLYALIQRVASAGAEAAG